MRNHDHTATNTYTRAYQFDKLGNVLQEQHTADGNASNSFTKTFNYHATQEHNRLLSFSVGGNTYTHAYDANGNLITENSDRHHEWGYDDKLRHFRVEAGGSPTKWAHYLYDSSGTRVKKVINKPSGIQEVTICIDGVLEHSYTKNSGSIDTDKHYNTLHVLDGNSRIATVRIGNNVNDSTPLVQYCLEDHLGNSCVVLDDQGDLVNREEYYPFGETCFGAFAKKRYRYNGKEKDDESGLYNYGMRYYAPWMCRFISIDPLAADYVRYTPYQYAGTARCDLSTSTVPSKPSRISLRINPPATPPPLMAKQIRRKYRSSTTPSSLPMFRMAQDVRSFRCTAYRPPIQWHSVFMAISLHTSRPARNSATAKQARPCA